MRLGKVKIVVEYAVDMNDEDMILHAKDCLLEDIYNAIKFNEMDLYVKVEEDKNLTEKDIPDFLREEENL
jgi:uncharacterized protein (DUF433 family)